MKAPTFKTWYAIHKWTSLVCTFFMLLLCITGLPLIFMHEIDHAQGNTVDPPELSEPQASQRTSIDLILQKANALQPGHAVQFIFGDPDEPNIWTVRLGKTAADSKASAFLTFDARTAEFLNAYPVDTGFMNIMLRLHVDLFAGLPGMLFLGFMGMLLSLSLISGLMVYGPYMQKLKFGTVRRDKTKRIEWLDLHNLIGITTMVWLLAVGVTGVINTLSIPIFQHWQTTQLAEMVAPYRQQSPLNTLGSAQTAVETALKEEPNLELSFMAFPGNPFASPHHYVAFMRGNTPLTSKLLKPLLIDAESGRLVDKRELPWYVSLLLLSQPLHFGDYGGLPLKIIWSVLDLLSIIVLGSGIYLWIKKRQSGFVPSNEERLFNLMQ